MVQNHLMKCDEENDSNKKSTTTVKMPLTHQQLNMIKNTIIEGHTVEEASKIIKNTVNTTRPEILYATLLETLEPLFREKTKQVVGMLFMYKKKMCRNGDACPNRDKCIFLHESEINDASVSKRPLVVEESAKRVLGGNKEVVFNRVPSYNANECLIKEYAAKFGEVNSVKKLNDGKFLIVFSDADSSKRLMEAKEPVMGDETITKFFNVLLNDKQNELNIEDYFEEQEDLLNMGPSVLSEYKNFMRLKMLCKKIKECFDSNVNDDKKNIQKDKNISFSLYAEHFK